MTLRIYDSASQSVRDFEPLERGKVSIYICGLTVQGSAHVGHVRFAVAFDQLRRWLTAGHGYDVTLIRNVTDIEDKILTKAKRNRVPWWAWAYKFERETTTALDALGVLPPTYEPRATAHIDDMIAMMERLIERGHAYVADDGSGDVYFDVPSFPQYGELTRQTLNELEPAADGGNAKRDPRDFALWKGRPSAEPGVKDAAWQSPWGVGRPGWHLECSAMAYRYFGESFDIHGGGVDLRFPHHENEVAQSKGCGYGFAQYWMHNAWVTMSGEKMSKSLGNSVIVREMLRETRPLVLRYYLGSAQYRSTIEFSHESLAESGKAVARLERFFANAADMVGSDIAAQGAAAQEVPQAFRDALDDDMNVSGALGVVFDTVRAGNTALEAGDREATAAAVAEVSAMTEILGINPTNEHWAGACAGNSGEDATNALDQLVQARLSARDEARAAKDFATADAIRDELTAAGVVIEDTANGARWKL